MLVAAIVIGIAYTAFTVVSQSYLQFKAKNEGIAELATLDHLFKRDFEQAERIQDTTNGIAIYKKNQIPVVYQINLQTIIRSQISTDTFKVKLPGGISGFQTFFEGKSKSNQTEENASSTNAENNRIDEVSFSISYQDQHIPYHYTKTYSSASLIERSTHALY